MISGLTFCSLAADKQNNEVTEGPHIGCDLNDNNDLAVASPKPIADMLTPDVSLCDSCGIIILVLIVHL